MTAAERYALQRRVNLLRQQLFQQPAEAVSAELLKELQEAEVCLAEAGRAAPPAPGQPRQFSKDADFEAGLLYNSASVSALGDEMLGPETTGVDMQVLLRQSHVPLGLVHLLDAASSPLVTFSIHSRSDQTLRLRVESHVERYSARAVETVEILPGQSVDLHQLPTFFPDRIRGIHELTRATLQVRVDHLAGETEMQRSYPIWLLPRTTAYNGIFDPATGKWKDLTPYLAAWVTPDTPEIFSLLREAADLHPMRLFAGYQVDAAGVEAQVRAIFQALHKLGILYINSVTTLGCGEEATTQRVRLPREAIRMRSANCIDGTVLMASLLEAATLTPAIVLIPGHAFLGWKPRVTGADWDYLETTEISAGNFETARDKGRLLAAEYQKKSEILLDPSYFRRYPIPDLRIDPGIMPME